MAAFPLTSLRSVEIELADLAAAHDFYTRVWGLAPAGGAAGTLWLRGTGPDPYLLAIHRGERSAIRSMTLRAAPGSDLEALARGIVAQGGTLVAGPHASDEPGAGTLAIARDASGRTIRLVQDDAMLAPLGADPNRPERLAHVNINSDDMARDIALFTRGLGFSLTDRSRLMAFVRTNTDHHSIVIAEAPVNTLNHIAFQLPGWEGVMRAAGRVVDAGFPIGWGPGRHGPGDNVFAYFVDPFGFVVEYTADVLQVDDSYRVGGPDDWVWPAGRTDHWGIAPPKTPQCKAAQLAIPFA